MLPENNPLSLLEQFLYFAAMFQPKVIEIPLSKEKLVKGLVASIVFVLAGAWMLLRDPTSDDKLINNPLFRYGIGVSAILLFGAMAVLYLVKMNDKKPGMVIDENGIIDNSGALAVGFIPWTDITQFATKKLMKQEFLVILVKNPAYYINQQKSVLKKKGMQYNLSNYGSPVAISTNTLKCNLPELLTMLEERNKV